VIGDLKLPPRIMLPAGEYNVLYTTVICAYKKLLDPYSHRGRNAT